MLRRSWMAVFGLVLGVSGAFASEHVPGEVIVRYNDRVPDQAALRARSVAALKASLGADAVLGERPFKTDRNLSVIRLRRDRQLDKALSVLRRVADVAFAEPNGIVRLVADGSGTSAARGRSPDDPDLGKNWGVGKINIAPLWNEGFVGSRKVVVAVIDTGIDWTHPDLVGNLWTNPRETAGNATDDDGNGFVDDLHGWNWVAGTADSNDDQGHGSHCAGVIGAVGNNGVGVAGVNWTVSLMALKFLSSGGSGTIEAGVEAINYARLNGAQVMSNSWGYNGSSEALQQAIEQARDAGILFVAAAGNDGRDNDAASAPTMPGSAPVDNVVSVAATDSADKLASFSNWGRKRVHVAAPGAKIYSTYKDGAYKELSGTSMATPFVAGISALLLSEHPDWSYSEIKRRLIETSDAVPSLRTKVTARGRVNAYNAFHGIVTAEPEPDESAWESIEQVHESAHPYANKENSTYQVSVPGAKLIRVHFDKIETEASYDKVSIESPAGEVFDLLSGTHSDRTSEYLVGDTLVIRLKADYVNTAYGFRVDRVQVIR